MALIGKRNIKNVLPQIHFIIGDQLNKNELEPGDLLFDEYGYTYVMPNDKIKALFGYDSSVDILISLCDRNSNVINFGYISLNKLNDKLKYKLDKDFDIIGVAKHVIDLDKIKDKDELKNIFKNNNNFLEYRTKIKQLYASH